MNTCYRTAPSAEPIAGMKGRCLELDGIRGIAILMVLVFHFGTPAAAGVFQKALGIGWAGVDLFFVLSGLLITGILLDTKGSPDYFYRFYTRRIFRIFPIYYIFLILFFHLAPFINRTTGLLASVQYGRSDELSYWLYLSNWMPAFEQNRYLRHFWSLAIEEQFYMVWPLVIYLLPRRQLKWLCVAMVGLCPIARLVASELGISVYFLYRLTPFRLEGLALGALLALSARDPLLRSEAIRVARPAFAIATVILGLAILQGGTSYLSPAMSLIGYTALAITCAAIVFYAMEVNGSSGVYARTLRSGWLTSFGRYSYGAYVWHMPIAEQFGKFLEHHHNFLPRWILLPATIGAGCLVSWAIAWLSWHLIEGPCARLKGRLTDRVIARPSHASTA